jgi:Rrf2 family protein
MKRNSRLSVALHVLLHMAGRQNGAMTSEELATCAGTHAVVIRRTFAGLRKAGIVSSLKGHGGGWRLERPLSEITLYEVQHAIEEKVAPVAGPASGATCLIEQVVLGALDATIAEANRLIDTRLANVTLEQLFNDVAKLDHRNSPG